MSDVKLAAVAVVVRSDGRMLCVWNRRYAGWAFPGGLVEDGESIIDALRRELREETGMELDYAAYLYDGPQKTPAFTGRGTEVLELLKEWVAKHASTWRHVEAKIDEMLAPGVAAGRGSHVHVFRVSATGEPREMEDACPVTWLTKDEFLKWSPFSAFYADMFTWMTPAEIAP